MRLLGFDLDGVLVDSSRLYGEVVQEVLGERGLVVSVSQVASRRVAHVPSWVAALLPAKWRDQDPQVQTLTQEVRRRVAERAQEVAVDPQASEVLAELGSTYHLHLLTHSSYRFARSILQRAGLESWFAGITAADHGFATKARALQHLLDRAALPALQAAYVGDTRGDVQTAREVGCWAIVVYGPGSWDFGQRDAIEALAPDRVVEDLRQLPAALRSLWP